MLKPRPSALLIDDDDSFVATFKHYLGTQFQIRNSSSVQEATKSLGEIERLEIVFLDKKLPDGSGLSLIGPIRQKFPSAAIIVLTGDSDFGSVHESLERGADDYLVKSANLVPDVMLRAPIALHNAQARVRIRIQDSQGLEGVSLPSQKSDVSSEAYHRCLTMVERLYLKRAIDLFESRIDDLAACLQMGRSTLFKKINELQIPRGSAERSADEPRLEI